MNTKPQTDQDRITQLEASCAAMRESLLRIEKFEEEWGPHSLTAWNEVVATCKQSLSSTDAGKSLLDRITQLEAACAAMREALTDPTRLTITGGVVIPGDLLNKALSTDAGKDLLNLLQKAEADRDAHKAYRDQLLEEVSSLKLKLEDQTRLASYKDQTATTFMNQVRKLQDRLQAVEKDYNELLFAVASKFSGETRHQTALRYIRQREEAWNSKDAAQPKDALPVDNEGSMARRAAQGGMNQP